MNSQKGVSQLFGIIGFGNQAKTWAFNLRDSGFDVEIFLRKDSLSKKEVELANFKCFDLDSLHIQKHQYIAVLTPDHTHLSILNSIALNLKEQTTLIFAHGFSQVENQFHLKWPKLQYLLLAPKSIASEMRKNYLAKLPIAAVYSLENGPQLALETVLNISSALGITQGPFEATFEQETQADLFSEQAILCSSIPEVARLVYNAMRSKGIPPELAFYECFHEMKLIVDAFLQKGPLNFFDMISPNALCGGYKASQILFDKEYQKKLDTLWSEIVDGGFTRWIDKTNPTQIRHEIQKEWRKGDVLKQFDQYRAQTNAP